MTAIVRTLKNVAFKEFLTHLRTMPFTFTCPITYYYSTYRCADDGPPPLYILYPLTPPYPLILAMVKLSTDQQKTHLTQISTIPPEQKKQPL